MNLASLDLNLLVALDALLAEASVGRAAARLGLSQPATSHALRRLRLIMRDPLLVRVGARMELTPRAEAVREPLAEALIGVRRLFVTGGFEPGTSSRQFSLIMADYVANLIMPPLIERISAEAPGIRIELLPWQGPAAMTPAGRRLARLPAFLEARHVAVVGRGHREDPVDTWLRGKGVARRIALVVPSYLQALHTVACTDLVAFVPSRLIESLAGPLSLAAVAPPIDPGIDEGFMFYPTRLQGDPASIWLRGLVLAIGRGLDRQRTKAA